MMHALCRKKERARVPRALGWNKRVEAKKKQPRRKQPMESRDLIQPFGWAIG